MKIVIVGGGFGGVRAALELERRGFSDVTLISERNYFLDNSQSYRLVCGVGHKNLALPFKEIFGDDSKVKLVRDRISSIDVRKRLVRGRKKGYAYDKLILATGLENNFHGVNGAGKHSFGFGTPEGIEAFSKSLHDRLISTDQPLRCAVIGGGATGVELAGALENYVRKIQQAHGLEGQNFELMIIEKRARLLPKLSKSASKKITNWMKRRDIKVRLNAKVEKIAKDYLIIKGRKTLVDMTIWASGSKSGEFFSKLPDIFCLSKQGRVIVNDYLSAYPDIFVIGDSAETPHAGLAETAMKQADFVARNLYRLCRGQSQKIYKPGRRPMVSLKLDNFWAYSEFGGVYAAGISGSILGRLAKVNQFNHLLSYQKSVRIYKNQQNAPEICRLCQKQRKINH